MNLKLIKDKRIEKGYSCEYMAREIGLKERALYYKRETGEYKFKVSEIPTLIKILDLNYEKIFELDVEQK